LVGNKKFLSDSGAKPTRFDLQYRDEAPGKSSENNNLLPQQTFFVCRYRHAVCCAVRLLFLLLPQLDIKYELIYLVHPLLLPSRRQCAKY